MKSFIVLVVMFTVALAAPADPPVSLIFNPDAEAVILRYDNENIGVNGYSYAYETSNGIAAQEEARLVEVGTKEEYLAVQGEFSYPGPNGILYSVSYTADRNGFVARGSHLPNSPKI